VAKEELDRAETFKLTDEGLYSGTRSSSRSWIATSSRPADVAGPQARREREALLGPESALGEIDAGKAKLKVTIAEKGLAR